MELVKLGKKGQITIPKALLRSIGLVDDAPLIVEATSDGAIILRPAAVYPIEMYSEERIAEFEKTSAVSAALVAKTKRLLTQKKK
jgi:AbrB family looped-hinge helix DNA binding protein